MSISSNGSSDSELIETKSKKRPLQSTDDGKSSKKPRGNNPKNPYQHLPLLKPHNNSAKAQLGGGRVGHFSIVKIIGFKYVGSTRYFVVRWKDSCVLESDVNAPYWRGFKYCTT